MTTETQRWTVDHTNTGQYYGCSWLKGPYGIRVEAAVDEDDPLVLRLNALEACADELQALLRLTNPEKYGVSPDAVPYERKLKWAQQKAEQALNHLAELRGAPAGEAEG